MILLGIFKRKSKNNTPNRRDTSVRKTPQYVVTLDKNNFNQFIQKYPLSMVDFWASWCAPCRVMAPRLRRLSKIYRDKMAFGKQP